MLPPPPSQIIGGPGPPSSYAYVITNVWTSGPVVLKKSFENAFGRWWLPSYSLPREISPEHFSQGLKNYWCKLTLCFTLTASRDLS